MDAAPSSNAAGRDAAQGGPGVAGAGSSVVCATCHRPLACPGREGICVRCLASLVLLADDESPEEEGADDGPGVAQNHRYGHFEILMRPDGSLVELGHGAMGTTYRARDTVLHRVVALKVIGRGVARHPAARTRFLREARAAAQFQHPNVATVSHYGEQDGECFYAMELVEGETLEARVQREGPLPSALTLEIASQIARALMAAEARGVVHRDLKPTNLMLSTQPGEGGTDGTPTIKVIDFGLAKAVTAAAEAPGATETRGGFVGTPAFASPEQFEAPGDARIDHRSDIYSLGTTMWYALSGRVPFAGRNLAEIYARQSDELPVEQLAARAVPAPLVTLLRSMLAVDPAVRPQSARELLEALRRCLEQAPAAPTPARRSGWRYRAALASVPCVVAAVLAVAWWPRTGAEADPDGQSLAVLPFENLSPDSGDAFFTTGMQDEISADLAHLAALKVVGADGTRDYPAGKRDFTRIGRELGVRHFLEGDVRREGEQVRVRVRLIDGRDAAHPWTATYERRLADVFIVQSEIAQAIADHLRTPLSAEERRAISEPPTTDLAAYDLYLRAREISEAPFDSTTELFANLGKIIPLLDEAVTRDPNFVLAFCALADAHDTYYSYRVYASPEQRMVDHRALAETALQKARRLRPEAGEVHLAAAFHFFKANRDPEQARIEVELARHGLPNSAEREELAGRINRTQGHWDEAVRCLQRAIALNPRNLGNHGTLCQTYHLMRRWDDFARASTELMAILPPPKAKDADPFPTISLERDADLAPWRAYLASVPVDRHYMGDDMGLLILHLFEHDADAVSRTVASSNRLKYPLNGSVFPKAWYEGLAARMRGDAAAARLAFADARIEAEKTVTADATDALNLSVLAMIDAGLGRTEEAVAEGRRACEMLPVEQWARSSPMAGSNLAVVYAWTGQPDLAIAKLQELARRPSGENMPIQPSYGDLRLNPVWDPLRGDKRFALVVEQLAPPARPEQPSAR